MQIRFGEKFVIPLKDAGFIPREALDKLPEGRNFHYQDQPRSPGGWVSFWDKRPGQDPVFVLRTNTQPHENAFVYSLLRSVVNEATAKALGVSKDDLVNYLADKADEITEMRRKQQRGILT